MHSAHPAKYAHCALHSSTQFTAQGTVNVHNRITVYYGAYQWIHTAHCTKHCTQKSNEINTTKYQLMLKVEQAKFLKTQPNIFNLEFSIFVGASKLGRGGRILIRQPGSGFENKYISNSMEKR